MLKYPCLVLDHDDTVVQSEATVNYPYFCYILDKFRPGTKISLSEYTQGCYSQGFVEMCKSNYHFSDSELAEEYRGWKEYILHHIPDPYECIGEIITRQKASGGLVCVVSHSTKETISRDYLMHFGFLPDHIYGWDLPEHQRKPNPYPLEEIMRLHGLSPSELLVVDDMKPGWEMARKVDVSVAFAAWGRQACPQITQEMSQLCDYSFHSPQELYDFLYEA